MDISRYNFHFILPSIFAAIADAHFVAIDLELSGIPSRHIDRIRHDGDKMGGRASLQQRYEETRKAAEIYQVLQLGITCVGVNEERGR